MSPLSLRRLSRDELAYLNLMAQRRRPLNFDWLDSDWTFEWLPAQPRRNDLSEVRADWGGAMMVLRMDPATVDDVSLRVLGAPVASSAPRTLVAALLETALGDLLTLVESVTRRRVRLLGDDAPASADCVHCIGWRLSADGQESTGELWVDALGLGFLAAACKVRLDDPRDPDEPESALSPAELEALPIPFTLSAGWTDLPAAQLSKLRRHDVLLIEECWLDGDAGLTVRVGQALGFRVAITGTHLQVTERLRPIMTDSNLHSHDDELDPEALDDIPVRLTFDLGERTMTIAELRAIVPGQIFDLGRELRRAVIVRANGRTIAEGELVDIDGRLGVSIASIGQAAS